MARGKEEEKYITKVKVTTKWLEESRIEVEINPTDTGNKKLFRIQVEKFKGLQEEPSKKATRT